jgi:hypothetical protein
MFFSKSYSNYRRKILLLFRIEFSKSSIGTWFPINDNDSSARIYFANVIMTYADHTRSTVSTYSFKVQNLPYVVSTRVQAF